MLAVLFAAGIKGLSGEVSDNSSMFHKTTSLIRPTVSGVFLMVIGILNLIILWGIIRVFRRMRLDSYDEAQLEDQLNKPRSDEPVL